MTAYTVTLANTFNAESPEDAVRQMVTYVADYAAKAGYRVYNESTDVSVFIDAEELLCEETTYPARGGTVEDILASSSGLQPGGLIDLTDDEADAFFEAMGL